MLNIDNYMGVSLDELDDLLVQGTISLTEHKNMLQYALERLEDELLDIQIDLEDDEHYRNYVNINTEIKYYVDVQNQIIERLNKGAWIVYEKMSMK